ncbi:hypothetical protein BHM03_00056804 [Ensete ventricosum]|nr:hypothetical protein BHM03_00056804 [Ensete ventricosum]
MSTSLLGSRAIGMARGVSVTFRDLGVASMAWDVCIAFQDLLWLVQLKMSMSPSRISGGWYDGVYIAFRDLGRLVWLMN